MGKAVACFLSSSDSYGFSGLLAPPLLQLAILPFQVYAWPCFHRGSGKAHATGRLWFSDRVVPKLMIEGSLSLGSIVTFTSSSSDILLFLSFTNSAPISLRLRVCCRLNSSSSYSIVFFFVIGRLNVELVLVSSFLDLIFQLPNLFVFLDTFFRSLTFAFVVACRSCTLWNRRRIPELYCSTSWGLSNASSSCYNSLPISYARYLLSLCDQIATS